MRIAGMNLLAVVIIFWNTARLGEIVDGIQAEGYDVPVELLRHVTPLGWEHIILTGGPLWGSCSAAKRCSSNGGFGPKDALSCVRFLRLPAFNGCAPQVRFRERSSVSLSADACSVGRLL